MTESRGETATAPASQLWPAVWDWVKTLLLCLVLALTLRVFVLESYTIDGSCMEPTTFTGQRVFVWKLSYLFSEPDRGDIIVFRYPLDPSRDYIKRVIALPGETVALRGGAVYINGEKLDESSYPITVDLRRYPDYAERLVPEGHCFVMGDNRPESEDSRVWGFVPLENVKGRAFLLWWPFWQAAWLG
jgi:signal peptidase I